MSIIKDNWDISLDINEIEQKEFTKFSADINNLCENVLKLLVENFIIQSFNNPSSVSKCYDEEFKLLTEGNKELREQIETKTKELIKQQEQYESFKKDQKLLSQEIKETHEAFLMAKKYYKKYLKIYFTIESRNIETQIVFVQFFTESKKDTDLYSARLFRHLKSRQFNLQSVYPNLKNFKELEKKLADTNDVPGVLCCIRRAFLKIRGNKKK